MLELAIAKELYDRYPDASEGRLAKIRSHVVSRQSCAAVARELHLGERLGAAAGEALAGDELAGSSRAGTCRRAARGGDRGALPRARLRARSRRRSWRRSPTGSSTRERPTSTTRPSSRRPSRRRPQLTTLCRRGAGRTHFSARPDRRRRARATSRAGRLRSRAAPSPILADDRSWGPGTRPAPRRMPSRRPAKTGRSQPSARRLAFGRRRRPTRHAGAVGPRRGARASADSLASRPCICARSACAASSRSRTRSS